MATTMERSARVGGDLGVSGGILRIVPAGLAVIAVAATVGALSGPSVGSVGVIRALVIALWIGAGVVLGLRKRSESLGSIVALGAALGALAAFGDATDLLGARAAALVTALALSMLPPVGLHMIATLPDGRFARRSRRIVVTGAYIGSAVWGIALGLARASMLVPVVIAIVVAGVAAVVMSVSRYQRAHGIERQRMQWFGWAVTAGASLAVVAGATRLLVSWPHDPVLVAAICTALIPMALIASTSEKLVPRIDKMLEQTVAVAGLLGLIAVIYVVVVLGLGRVPNPDERTLLLLSMAAAVVAALLYMPTRDRLNDLAARVVYGERHAPDEVLRTFGSRMSRAVPMDELLLQAAESLRKTFALDAVEIWTGQAGQLERTVSDPERGRARMEIGAKELPVLVRAGVTGPAWLRVWLPSVLDGREDSMVRLAPVTHQGELLGAIIIERYDSADVFGEEPERVLTELARTIGIALHNVQLDSALQETLDEVRRQAERLRASRERLVKAADVARRKIERDLHDGPQQHVVALKVKVKLAQMMLDSDVDGARAILGELGGDIQDAIQALRDLSHGIMPPTLVEFGLEAALNGVADKAAIPTTVVAGGLNRYPLEVETAVYFCCSEALQNASKHAGEGATATITITEDEGVLRFQVADDGAGFALSSKGLGAGFVNMDDRVGALGGSLSVESEPGRGTRIAGRIPIG